MTKLLMKIDIFPYSVMPAKAGIQLPMFEPGSGKAGFLLAQE